MYEIFEQLLQKFGVTTADVCKATGIGQSTMSNWKNRRNLISGKNAQLIADYFGVSIDYLMTGEESEQREVKTAPGVNFVDKEGNAKSYDMDSIIYNILQCLIRLPQESQEMIYDVAESQEKRNKKVIYIDNPNERKNKYNLMPNAAHDSTDRKVTEADIKHDEDIMNDDNF